MFCNKGRKECQNRANLDVESLAKFCFFESLDNCREQNIKAAEM